MLKLPANCNGTILSLCFKIKQVTAYLYPGDMERHDRPTGVLVFFSIWFLSQSNGIVWLFIRMFFFHPQLVTYFVFLMLTAEYAMQLVYQSWSAENSFLLLLLLLEMGVDENWMRLDETVENCKTNPTSPGQSRKAVQSFSVGLTDRFIVNMEKCMEHLFTSDGLLALLSWTSKWPCSMQWGCSCKKF